MLGWQWEGVTLNRRCLKRRIPQATIILKAKNSQSSGLEVLGVGLALVAAFLDAQRTY
jgi:hypothetical protein